MVSGIRANTLTLNELVRPSVVQEAHRCRNLSITTGIKTIAAGSTLPLLQQLQLRVLLL
jgi:hypothetical protein